MFATAEVPGTSPTRQASRCLRAVRVSPYSPFDMSCACSHAEIRRHPVPIHVVRYGVDLETTLYCPGYVTKFATDRHYNNRSLQFVCKTSHYCTGSRVTSLKYNIGDQCYMHGNAYDSIRFVAKHPNPNQVTPTFLQWVRRNSIVS